MGRASDPKEREEERKYTASQKAADNLLRKLGVRVEYLDRWLSDPPDEQTYVYAIHIKEGAAWDGGILFVLRAQQGSEKVVGFHSSDSLVEGFAGLAQRLANGSFQWKVDVPYGDRNGNAAGS